MHYLFRPKRNGLPDNLLGALCCIAVAALIYVQPMLHAVCQATRIGAEKYLWFCIFPVMMLNALVLASVLFPTISIVISKLSLVNRMGFGILSVVYGSVLALCVIIAIAFEPEVLRIMPQAFLAGTVAGLVFALARDHVRSLGSLFGRPSSGDNTE